MNKGNCTNCINCFRDESVGHRECLMEEFMTENEVEKYDAEMEDGCPYYKSEAEGYQDFLEAIVKTNYFGL